MRRARVLVVDDERLTAEIIGRYLSALGHSVESAGSGAEAAAKLSAAAYDLVLLDIVLPDTTGLRALGLLRGLTRAPIHVMSGQSEEDAGADARLLGAAGFLSKPFEFKVLADLIAALPEPPPGP